MLKNQVTQNHGPSQVTWPFGIHRGWAEPLMGASLHLTPRRQRMPKSQVIWLYETPETREISYLHAMLDGRR